MFAHKRGKICWCYKIQSNSRFCLRSKLQFKLNRNQISPYTRENGASGKSISKSKFETFDHHFWCGELFTILGAYNDRLELKRCNLVEEIDHKVKLWLIFLVPRKVSQPTCLNPGTSWTTLPSVLTQVIWGNGVPRLWQIISAPVVLEKSIWFGGSCTNTGPDTSDWAETEMDRNCINKNT